MVLMMPTMSTVNCLRVVGCDHNVKKYVVINVYYTEVEREAYEGLTIYQSTKHKPLKDDI